VFTKVPDPYLGPDEPNQHPQPYFPKIHFNVVLPPMPRPSTSPLTFSFPTKFLYAFLILITPATCPANLSDC
jgi:hypothetical protein